MRLSPQQLDQIARHKPAQRSELSLMKAAVAIILRDGDQGTEFLLMQRSAHPNDPWSGQMSFPGGKIEDDDSSPLHAAIREVEEEVGIELAPEEYLGQLDDVYGLKVDNRYSVHVSCFVFKLQREVNPKGNYEVADLVWLPLIYLEDLDNAHEYYHPQGEGIRMPAVLIDQSKEQILWGLSLRMLNVLYDLLGLELSILSEHDKQHLEDIDKQNIKSEEIKGPGKRFLQGGRS